MTSIIRKVGHIVKHGPGIIKRKVATKTAIKKLKNQTEFSRITPRDNDQQIIVSLTSYKKRFSTLDICIKSILNQTMLPDRLVLYLSKDENIEEVPNKVKELQKFGLEIKFVDLDLKPHKKYYYAMQEFPNDIVITIDDDIIYYKNMIKELILTYKKFPGCIIAARAHEITFDEDGKIKKYEDWKMCSTKSNLPSFNFCATEGAGTLYPPHLLNTKITLNLKYINKYIDADDLWMKANEVLSNIPVVISNPKLERKRIEIPSSQEVGLKYTNVDGGKNDFYLKQLESDFSLSNKLNKAEERLRVNE